jgi:hypothetical protein
MTNNANDLYFEWLLDQISGEYFNPSNHEEVLLRLYLSSFYWSIPRDENRAIDAVELREFFADDYYMTYNELPYLDPPTDCSVLEVMIALSDKMENPIMSDSRYGDRTGYWFGTMLNNLGLLTMADDIFNERMTNGIIERFLNRDYSPEGRGNLFEIPDCTDDLREIEIWQQMMIYLNYELNKGE